MIRRKLLLLNEAMKKELIDACISSAPRESCGFIADDRVIHVPNRSVNDSTFRIVGQEAAEILRAEGLGSDDITAVWHTHPSGTLVASDIDVANHPWHWALVIATSEAVRIYHGRETA